MSKGWISISRSLEDSWIFEEPEALKFWMALLMKANWETKTTMFNKRLITVERGQVVFGRKAWSERLKISEKKLRRYLELLVAEGMVGQQTTSRYSMITVLNYDQHQDKGQPRASQGPAEGQPRATSKPLNNITIKQQPPKSVNKFTDKDMEIAKNIHFHILEVTPKAKEPNFNSWANDVRLMREQDSHTHEEIEKVFIFANKSHFWKTNILSTSKLREKFPTLHAKMISGERNANSQQSGYANKPSRSDRADEATRRYMQEEGIC